MAELHLMFFRRQLTSVLDSWSYTAVPIKVSIVKKVCSNNMKIQNMH